MTKRKRRSSGAPVKRRSSGAPAGWTSERLSEMGLSVTQQRILLVMGSVAGILAAALAMTLLVDAIGGGRATPPVAAANSFGQARPEEYQAWPSLKQFAPIDSRTADAKPLTVEEIFGAKTLKVGKITLKRVATSLDGGCAGVVWGAELAQQLAEAGCREAVRGLFASSDGSYVAQYTMLDLSGVEAANGLVEALKSLHRGGWAVALPSKRAAFQRYTEASGHAMGHFVGLVWIGRADGAEPTAKDDFVTLTLTAREVEKAVYRRVVAVTGVDPVPSGAASDVSVRPSEPAPEPTPSQG